MKHVEKLDKIGFALGGGAGKSFFQGGALEQLTHAGIVPHKIAGVSAGALAAALYLQLMPDNIDKLKHEAMRRFAKRPYFFKKLELLRRPWKSLSLLSNAPLRQIIADLDIEKICASPTELIVVCVNSSTWEEVEISNHTSSPHDFRKALIATTSIPGWFVREKFDNFRYSDGGSFRPLPIGNLTRAGCKTIFAISTSPEVINIPPDVLDTQGWPLGLEESPGVALRRLEFETEIGRHLRINENIAEFHRGSAKLKEDILSTAENVPWMEATYEHIFKHFHHYFNFYFQRMEIIPLIVIRPHTRLVDFALFYDDHASRMYELGKKIAKTELEKAYLI